MNVTAASAEPVSLTRPEPEGAERILTPAALDFRVEITGPVDRTIAFTSPEGKRYRLADQTAVLFVRPRGWHLSERHLLVDGEPVSGSLFDFGLFFFHNARSLLAQRGRLPAKRFEAGRFALAAELLVDLMLNDEHAEWLTTAAYQYLD